MTKNNITRDHGDVGNAATMDGLLRSLQKDEIDRDLVQQFIQDRTAHRANRKTTDHYHYVLTRLRGYAVSVDRSLIELTERDIGAYVLMLCHSERNSSVKRFFRAIRVFYGWIGQSEHCLGDCWQHPTWKGVRV